MTPSESVKFPSMYRFRLSSFLTPATWCQPVDIVLETDLVEIRFPVGMSDILFLS